MNRKGEFVTEIVSKQEKQNSYPANRDKIECNLFGIKLLFVFYKGDTVLKAQCIGRLISKGMNSVEVAVSHLVRSSPCF